MKMAIQGKIDELNSIKIELKSLRVRSKHLRSVCSNLENEIDEYLEQKDQQGIKYKGTAITRQTSSKRSSKNKTDIRTDGIRVLEKNGVDNPEKVYDEMMEARLGEEKYLTKLKFTPIKSN
jgi:hypothetical protein